MKKVHRTIILLSLMLLFFFLLGGKKIFQPQRETRTDYQYLSLFSKIVSLVKTDYVEDVKASEKFPGAFSGMLSSLDPFSAYLDANETPIYLAYESGNYYSPGIFGTKYGDYFLITDIEPGSPAQKAGLIPGDRIKAIKGKSLYSLSFWEMYLSLMDTKPGQLEITLYTQNDRETKKVSLGTTTAITGTTIKQLNNNILLVKLHRFDNASLQKLKKHLAHPTRPEKIIIDLRKYAGGDLESFKEISKLFIPSPISMTLKTKEQENVFLLGSKNVQPYKAAIIVNKSTRLYGELFASLFKHVSNSRPEAVNAGNTSNTNNNNKKISVSVVGTKTMGFISDLKFIPMEDGSSLLLTSGLFLLEGKKTARQGIIPDVEISDKHPEKIIDSCISFLNKKESTPNPKQTNAQNK